MVRRDLEEGCGVAVRLRIGELLVQLGYVSQEEVDAALEAQEQTGQRLGEILVERGKLSEFALASALSAQWELRESVQEQAVLGPEQADRSAGTRVLAGSVDPGRLAVIVEDLSSVEDAGAAAIEFGNLEEVRERPGMDLAHDLLGRLESQIIDLAARQASEGRTFEDAVQQLRDRVDQQRADLSVEQAARETLQTARTQNTLEAVGVKLSVQQQLDELRADLSELRQQVQALADRESPAELLAVKKEKKLKQKAERKKVTGR
jgi:hypothetical protein